MPAGYSGTPLPKKLGIKPGHRVGVVRAPENLDSLLDGVRWLSLRAGAPRYNVILLFAHTKRRLDRDWQRAVDRLDVDGGLWVAWPKKSSGLHEDLGEADVRSFGLARRLVDNKVCAINEDWSGLRFVYRLVDRAEIRMQHARDS